jgi:glycine cleavage system regulatory protein
MRARTGKGKGDNALVSARHLGFNTPGMKTRVILSAAGSDRPGLTRMLAEAVLAAGGNWLESHLSRLGGRYVGSVLVELDSANLETFEAAIRAVDAKGLAVSLVEAGEGGASAGETLLLDLVGGDRPGIVHEVTGVLAELGVNIESFATRTEHGAWSGESLFARLSVPAGTRTEAVRQALEAISGEIMVDFTFAAEKG